MTRNGREEQDESNREENKGKNLTPTKP